MILRRDENKILGIEPDDSDVYTDETSLINAIRKNLRYR